MASPHFGISLEVKGINIEAFNSVRIKGFVGINLLAFTSCSLTFVDQKFNIIILYIC